MSVLAIDAGGSSSRALMVDDGGSVLSAVRGGPAGAGLPPEALAEALGGLLGTLRVQANAPDTEAVLVVAGFAGAGRPEGARRAEYGLRAALAAAGLRPARLDVTTDVHIALRAVAPGSAGPAAVLVAGTGSIALAGVPGGATARAGGWGRYLGDEGGGFWLGRRALEAVGRFADGRSPDAGPLARAALEALGLRDIDALTLAAPGLWAQPARVAALAPAVLALARSADPAASALVGEAGEALAGILLQARRAAALGPEAPTGLAGGLWLAAETGPGWSGGPLRAALLRALPPDVAATCRPLPVPPVVGAACSALAPPAAATLTRACAAGSRWAPTLG